MKTEIKTILESVRSGEMTVDDALLAIKKEPEAPKTKKCPYCCTDIDIKATRCPHCTSVLNEELVKA